MKLRQELADKLPTSLRRIEAFEQGEPVPPQYLKRALRDLEQELPIQIKTSSSQ
jgi:hypothetical protein